MEFNDVIKSRTSTRKFSNEKISDSDISKILEAGRLAPTAKNNQPQVIYVIRSEENLKKVDLVTPCRYNSSTCIFVCSNIDVAYKIENYSSYEMDASIVATHIILEATNIGVDSIWVRRFDNERAKQEFDLDDNIIPVCFIMLGKKDINCPENKLHKERKKIEETVKFL